jgi:hypothetical protein
MTLLNNVDNGDIADDLFAQHDAGDIAENILVVRRKLIGISDEDRETASAKWGHIGQQIDESGG